MAAPSEFDRRAHEVFMRALDLPQRERAAFVSRACEGNPDLERYALELLEAAARADSFLSSPALERPASEVPEALGSYLILGLLGHGGMATVYEAEQKQPRRRVALKLLRRGVTSKESLLRFRLETEALATLRHPGIAQIYEAGATTLSDGTRAPFFAMELVPEARTIRQFSIEGHLSIEERLGLLIKVCDAVHHGHQNGIIHRDLKPGNVLVGPDGSPKVIDFGVAKSLTSGPESPTEILGEASILGTLNYMSPEQCVASKDVDVQSDVYALGVMLYELVTGRLPHDLDGLPLPAAIRRIIDEPTSPPRLPPSAFNRDLEAIILRAIEKQPQRRYDGASALAADLRRLLAREAVIARPPGVTRSIALFARKHRALVSAAAVVAASLLLVTGLSAGFAWRLSQEVDARTQAEEIVSAERDRALWEAYIANINGAQSALGAGEIARALARLDAASSWADTWEHRFLSKVARRSVTIRQAPGGMIQALAHHPTRSTFVTCDDRGSVSLWACESQTPIATVALVEDTRISAACFDATGSHLFVATIDGMVYKLDPSDLSTQALMSTSSVPVADLASLPDSRIAIANGSPEPNWWGTDSPSTFPSPQSAGIDTLAGSPDGRWFATANDTGEIWVRDAHSLEPVLRLRFPGAVTQIRFDPGGTRLAAAGSHRSVLVWSIPDGQILHELEPATRATTVRSIAFSSDAQRLAVGLIHRGIVVFDLLTGERLGNYNGHTDAVSALLFLDHDRELLSTSWDRTIRTWRLSELDLPDGLSTLEGHEDQVYSVKFSPDGTVLASGSRDRTLRLWSPDLAQQISHSIPVGTAISALDFVPDGLTIAFACTDGSVRTFDRATGAIETLEPKFPGLVQSLAIDSHGLRVAAGAEDGSVGLWDLRTHESIALWQAHTARTNAVAFSPDGSLLATASRDKTVRLWNAHTGDPLPIDGRHESDVFAVLFSPNGSVLYSGSRDQTIGVWDTRSGQRLRQLVGHGQFVTCLALSPDGSRLAAGSWFGEVVLFDTRTGDQLLSLHAHDAAIRGIDFSSDGRWIATASHDGTIRLADSWSREMADEARQRAANQPSDAEVSP